MVSVILVFFIIVAYFFAAGCFLCIYLPFRKWGVEYNFSELLAALAMCYFAYSNISAYFNPENKISSMDLLHSCLKVLIFDVALYYMAKRMFKHYKNYFGRIEVTKAPKNP